MNESMLTASYDASCDALYLGLTDAKIINTTQVDPGLLVDVDEAAEPVGIEVIRPGRQWVNELIERFPQLDDMAAQLKPFETVVGKLEAQTAGTDLGAELQRTI